MKYPACILAKIIHPGKYCVISTDKEHVAEVKELEKKMQKEMYFVDAKDCSFSCQMYVAVEHISGQLRRGIIEKKLESNLYQILLIDYGVIVECDESKIKVITNKAFIEVEPLAFVVKLYGLIPTKNVYVEGVRKPRACKDWGPESRNFVDNILWVKQKVIVQSILIQQRTVYGELYIRPNSQSKYVSLRKLLCRNEFCVFSESNFVRLEGLNSSSESKELKMKMDLVEKWQKDNFAEVEKSSRSLPTLIKSPIHCLTDTSNDLANQSNSDHTSFEQLKRLGLGRGKLKLLIAEMKNKEKLVQKSAEQESNSSKEVLVPEPAPKPSIGRGGFLKKYWEIREVNKTVSCECILEVDEECRKPNVRKATSAHEISGSNEVVENSLLTNEDPLPLYQSLKVEDSSSTPTLIKEIILPTKPQDQETAFGSQSSGSYSLKKNFRVWQQPLNLIKASNCWAPYVVFDDTIVEPVNSFRELPIQHTIIKNLERGGAFRDLSQVQRWAIPAIRKQHNTVVIGSSKTGKTLSYIVPIIDYIQDCTYFEELPPGNGPFVVIVASSSRVCESVFYMCHSLLGNFTRSAMRKSKIKIVLAHGNGCEKEVWVNLTNGCNILISTPHCLVRLLEHPVLTNFERLTCLILDEIDVISRNPFRKCVRIILEKANFAAKDHHYQGILIGEKWTSNVESLLKTYIKSYALIIGSSSEAVIYKKLKPNIHLVDREHKLETLWSLLEGRIKKSRILVVCESGAEAIRLNDFLAEREVIAFVAHEKITADKLREIYSSWKMFSDSVLITTDGVLNELNIQEVQTLVHFELPTRSKTNFYLRFTTLEGFLRCSYLRTNTKDLNLQSIILVDDENHRQLPHIIDFVTRLGGKIPQKILGKCEEIRRVIETEKSDTPICRNVLSFGRCRDSKDCPQRHAFVKAWDSPTNLPTSGWVNFEILKTQDASCFYAKLIEHVDSEGNCNKLENQRSELMQKVNEFFKCENNQRILGVATYGGVCAVKSEVEGEEVFYRAKVVEVLKTDKHGKALEVNVKLLDEGDVWKRKRSELFELPSDLSDLPPTATDIYIVGIQPMDFDISWSGVANEFVASLFTQQLQPNQYWSGKIVLALDNTLFLEPIKRKEFLPLLKTHVFDLVVQGELLNKRIAVPNNEHLPALIKLCATGEIGVPGKGERKKEDLAIVQPQWAFFDLDFIRVTFLAAESTSTLFLQPKKFEKLLQELEEDCQKEAEETKSQKTKKSKQGELCIGMFCLALFEDGKWNRGRIEMENEKEFQIFFIDHGDFLFVEKPNVIPISQTLLLRLPCQAVECSLVGIQPEEECPVEVLQKIYSFSQDGAEDLYAYIVEKNVEPSVTNGRKYKINLLNTKGKSLNKILVDEGIVRDVECERKYLEDIEVVDSDEENAEEEEDEDVEGEEEEEEEQREKEKSWENCLTDDIFQNEEGLEFLKEFASKFLLVPCPTVKKVENNNELPVPATKQELPVQAAKPEIQPTSRLKTNLKTRENVLTPQVHWCQNQIEVQIKIILTNVQDYSLQCTNNNISFRCFVNEKFYAVDLKLYGAINPQLTKVTLKSFHVVVVLTKLAFPLWPRLHADDGKHRWINLDVESLVDKEGVFSEKMKKAKLEIESGLLKKPIRDEDVKAYSESEEEEDNVDLEFEEGQELE